MYFMQFERGKLGPGVQPVSSSSHDRCHILSIFESEKKKRDAEPWMERCGLRLDVLL